MPPRPAKDPACTVVLVRHGRTSTTGKVLPGRARGLHLSADGQAQAAAVAARLTAMSKPIASVYASPLERAQETAAPIARAAHVRVRTSLGLVECDFGTWTGARLATLRRRAEWRTVAHAPSTFRFPRGESFTEMQARIWDTVVSLAADHPAETIVAVSHADPIKAVVATALGIPLDLFQRTVISTCSVSVVVLGGAAPIVLCVNSLGALGELVAS